MDSFYRPTWIEISLDAFRHNLRAFRHLLDPSIEMMAVIKADAYGHGAIEIAKEALACGAKYLAVAFLDEALELRRANIKAPILILGHTPIQGLAHALASDITVNVYNEEMLCALAEQASVEHPVKIHIKIDTGMGRLGLHQEQQAIALIEQAIGTPGVIVEGLFTHYACADEEDKTYTFKQHRRFDKIVRYFADKGIRFPYVHAGNSAAAIDLPELTYNMVRLGIAMYGIYPSAEVNRQKINLQPVMSLKTRIVMVKSMPADEGISYGAVYRTQQDGERIATLPVGYADGYSRMLTGKARVLVNGQSAPVVGTICMDQCMINVTHLPQASYGDEVVLYGNQQGATLPVEEIAEALGTIPYEIVCMISHRVPKVYVSNGKVLHAINQLQHH
ncbi:alanine racemase [Paenibacillus sp. J2TS4]|uniref:alanine racemase n=1 Tax=Paenibacillus sp. J2TS4 TaxID=2807194 RepID=UPI001AFFBB03|nr:alanine racemase [Paenibacillus sp. J2TS4]GIP35081.1 alanine racemase [Paenibacillus sp. J2TS4]